MACEHKVLRFMSGDYYLTCLSCQLTWATISNLRPEHGKDKDGCMVGADPRATNVSGFVQHGDERDLRKMTP